MSRSGSGSCRSRSGKQTCDRNGTGLRVTMAEAHSGLACSSLACFCFCCGSVLFYDH
jgi:hypothetical protein